MKNSIFIFLISILIFQPIKAENLNIQSSEISIDKKSRLTIFKGDVVATDYKNNVFMGDSDNFIKIDD